MAILLAYEQRGRADLVADPADDLERIAAGTDLLEQPADDRERRTDVFDVGVIELVVEDGVVRGDLELLSRVVVLDRLDARPDQRDAQRVATELDLVATV